MNSLLKKVFHNVMTGVSSLARARPMNNDGLIKLIIIIIPKLPGMSGQNNEFSVAMVNRTVKYECALNFSVVNVLAQQ